MILLFELIIITVILVLGFKIVTQRDMGLQKWGFWIEKQVLDKGSIFELLSCQWCMPTLFSLPAFGIAFGIGILKCVTWNILLYYILNVGGSSVTCGLIWTGYLTLNAKKEYYDNAQKHYYLLNKKLKDGNKIIEQKQ